MRRAFFNIVIVSSAVAFFCSCAQQVGPTGGPKDDTPPKISESVPGNFSTGFVGRKIKIRFDEFVQLKDFQTKLIVSPPLKETPEFRIKGKTLELSFKDTLLPNTTYNFQFGDGILDITEGNALDSNIFVISTGTHIDSLFVRGVIKNAFNLAPEKDVMVLLYSEFDDSLPYISPPIYFTKTNVDGIFWIQYMRGGKYKLFALKDNNGNYFFDLPDEYIGFPENLIEAGDSSENKIFLFQEDVSRQFLKRGYADSFGKLIFVFAKPAEKPEVVLLGHSSDKAWYVEEFSPNKDTLVYWIPASLGVDTINVQVWDMGEIQDTVEIILPEREEKSQGKKRNRQITFPEKLVLGSNAIPSQPFDLFSALRVESIHPVKSIDGSKIFLVEKDDTLMVKLELADKVKRKYEIRHQWKESTDYAVFFLPGAMEDIFGLQNDTFSVSFKSRKKEDYGVIILTIEWESKVTAGAPYILQLMDMKENVVQQKIFNSEKTLKFENMLSSKYKMKLIFDSNKNSKWDTGNYLSKLHPEKVIYYSSPLELRPKFDLDITWKISSGEL